MAILINDNYSLQACKPFDARYLNICTPWTSVSAVNTAIPTYRYTGLTVNIQGTEYWYKNGIADSCLIPKTMGGTITGATNGLGVSGQKVCLGGRLTTSTDISSSISGIQELTFGGVKALDNFYVQGINDMLIELTGSSAQLYLRWVNGFPFVGSCAFLTAKQVSLRTTSGSANVTLSGTTVDITETVRLLSTPSGGTNSDSILVWNSTDKKIKKVSPASMVGLTGATNGLSTSGQKVVLGGDLTGNTCICTLGHCLSIGCSVNSELTVNSTAVSAFHCTNASNGSSISIYNTGLTLSNKISSVSCSVTLGASALVYGGNYCSVYTPRTLVDKEYVDKEVSGCSNMIKIKCVFGCNYNATTADDIIAVSGQSSCQIYLPISPVLCNGRGQRITVVDICGGALIDPIIVNGNINGRINGGYCSAINTDYGSITFVFIGCYGGNYNWSAIAFVN